MYLLVNVPKMNVKLNATLIQKDFILYRRTRKLAHQAASFYAILLCLYVHNLGVITESVNFLVSLLSFASSITVRVIRTLFVSEYPLSIHTQRDS